MFLQINNKYLNTAKYNNIIGWGKYFSLNTTNKY